MRQPRQPLHRLVECDTRGFHFEQESILRPDRRFSLA